MDIEQLNKASDLIVDLSLYIRQQYSELDAIKQSLEKYQDFLAGEIKRLRDEP